MSKCRFALFLLVFLVSGVSLFLSAHEQKTSLTDVFYNQRTGNLEIAHRISVHDAEHVLRRTGQKPDDLIHSEKARSLFADYVTTQFALKSENGSAIELDLVGQEIEGGYLWVYQEVPAAELPEKGFMIQNSILHDEVDQQINTVNVRFGSTVITFVFTAGSEPRRYERR
ncbi:MAG: DUF6702 family protein [Verrucomicrobiota bacterium]